MRAVVDTNIVIRSLIKPTGSVGPVLGRLRSGEFVAVYSEPILEEILEKLALPRIRNKYKLLDQDVEALVALLALRGELVNPERRIKVCRDPADDMFIEAAVAGNAEWVVTGDRDLLDIEKFESVRFASPRTFLQTF